MENNWRGMFEQGRGGPKPSDPPPTMAREEPDEDGLTPDLSIYKPWVIQRGRSRPPLMLDLRRYEPKSGMWMGWQLSYPHLAAVEYVGDRMISLDFGSRHFVIEGRGLDELTGHLQTGALIAIQEFTSMIWPRRETGAMVSTIRRVGTVER